MKRDNVEINKKSTKTPFSSIKVLDFYTKNEIIMGRHIQTIPGYYGNFHIVLKHSPISLSEVDKTLGLVKREGQKDPYVFLSYCFDSSQEFVSFYSYFGEIICKRKMILNVINSFKSLLKTVEMLGSNKIVHFSLNPENIVFDLIDNPYFTNFGKSFHYEKMDEERKSNLFSQIGVNDVFLPLEAKICLFLNNHQGSLSKSNIEQLCGNFFGQLTEIMGFIDCDELPNHLEKCKESMIFSLQSIINKSKEDAFKCLLTNCTSYWDHYSLCLIYLFLVKDLIDRGFSCHFLDDFSLLLTRFVFILFEKREQSGLCSLFLSKFDQMITKCDFDDLMP
jgi:hypothetical protein